MDDVDVRVAQDKTMKLRIDDHYVRYDNFSDEGEKFIIVHSALLRAMEDWNRSWSRCDVKDRETIFFWRNLQFEQHWLFSSRRVRRNRV